MMIANGQRSQPNIVVVLLDDAGFAQFGCFGAEIATPRIDALAANGLRFNSFHVTALCSPTRATLISGRNHHDVGIGLFPEIPLDRPGYSGRLPDDLTTLPGELRRGGYTTYAVGKWHLTPRWERSAAGPFTRWPLGMGFDRYYGFLGAESNQWSPTLVRDNTAVPSPADVGDGYHLTEDLADQASLMIRDHVQSVPDRPFFMYFATAAPHAPHHVDREWSDAYRGRFDDGWEAMRERVFAEQIARGVVPDDTTLTPRPSWVPDWSSLSERERTAYARAHEVFAGMMSHTDAQVGRLIDTLVEQGVYDDTVIVVLSDNGASAEGGPAGTFNEYALTLGGEDSILDRVDELGTDRGYQHYPWGWAWAGNTPFRLWKRYTWLGGTRVPFVISWPRGIEDRGAVRHQFCHSVDVMPTLLELADVERGAALSGSSFVAALDREDAPTRRTQYFEILGSRAIYHDGWKATTNHVIAGVGSESELLEGSRRFDDDRWHLFNLADDFSEAHDLSEEEPARLTRMIEVWEEEAKKHQVLPMIDGPFLAMIRDASAHAPGQRERYVYRGGTSPIQEDMFPALAAGFRLRAEGGQPTVDGTPAVVVAIGDWNNGWAVFVAGGRLHFAVSRVGRQTVLSSDPLSGGFGVFDIVYEPPVNGKPATVSFAADERDLGGAELPDALPQLWQYGGARLTIGHDQGLPVVDDYAVPSPWPGELVVTIDVGPNVVPDPESVLASTMVGD